MEPDESYEIENYVLAIEVNFTSGDASKLDRYQVLGVNEVWLWDDGMLAVYHLTGSAYKRVDRSQIPALTAINMTVLSNCVLIGETSIVSALKAFRSAHPIV